MTTIVLKDRLDVNQTFTFVSNTNGVAMFERSAAELLGRARVTFKMTRNTNVNRIKVVLSVPRLIDVAGDTLPPQVSYIQVASAEFSAVLFSSEEDRNDLVAMFASLVSNERVGAMVSDGIAITD